MPEDAILHGTELEIAQERRFGFSMWLPHAEKSKARLSTGSCLLLPVVAESSWLADLTERASSKAGSH